MKKLLKKAMVFTLAAAMLVGTPLTASAAPLVGVYQIEDGWGNVTGNKSNSRTGTVTATQTNSGILDANATLEGIFLNETNVELEASDETELVASLDWTEGQKDEDLEKKLLKTLQWRSSNTDVVALRVENRSYNGGSREKITVVPKSAGTATVTVSLDSDEHNIHYSATAAVTVLQYADDLKFRDDINDDAFTGNAIVLNDYVDRYVDGKVTTTSDVLTFAFDGDSKTASLKNGVLTFKKVGTVKVLAIGKEVKSDWQEIKIEQGHNAKTIEFSGTGVNSKSKKLAWKVNDGMSRKVTATVKDTKDGAKPCTDKISWSSKKPAIVDVSTTKPMKLEDDACSVVLTAKAPGKGQIVAKASSGKSATLNVTVSADLTDIVIEEEEMTMYSGQTMDLYDMADQYFKENGEDNFTDAGLKWSFDGDKKEQAAMKKVASISTKGVLTIKADVTVKNGTDVIKVKAANSKKAGDNKAGTISDTVTIKLEQVNITRITVNKGATLVAAAHVENGKVKQDKSKVVDSVAVNGSRIYTLSAEGTVGTGENIRDLTPEEAKAALGWSASGNGKIVKASKNRVDNGVIKAVKKGTATITISSATKNNKGKYISMKTTFKNKVTAPTKTLSLKVKNNGISATGKKQNITVTPVLEKGSTTNKNKDIEWTATRNGETVSITNGKIKNIVLTDEMVGQKIVVTAKVKNGGPRTSVTLTIVKPSKNVEFQESGKKISKKEITVGTETKVDVKINLNTNPKSSIGVDDEGAAKMTYTVNKTGVIRITRNGDGTITIDPLAKGSVKLTATTSDGKKGSLTVKVK